MYKSQNHCTTIGFPCPLAAADLGPRSAASLGLADARRWHIAALSPDPPAQSELVVAALSPEPPAQSKLVVAALQPEPCL